MYFEIVLFASLRCINDISLMNFSILPHGDLLYVAIPRLCFSGLNVPLLFSNSLFQSCFYSLSNIRC